MVGMVDRNPTVLLPARPGTNDETVVDRPVVPSSVSTNAASMDAPNEVSQDEDELADGVHAQPTAPGTLGSTTGAASEWSSPQGALHQAEVLRTRNFSIVGICLALSGAILIPQLPGSYVATRILLGAMAIAISGMLYLLHRTRTPATFGGIGITIGWYIPVLGVCATVPYFGAFSPAAILLVLGIFFTGLGGSLGVALSTYLTCAGVQAITSGLVITGVIADPGIIHASYLTPFVQLITQVLVQLVLACTFIISRASRRSALFSLAELERAVRAVAHREALLEEAREELRRVVGSGRGRFSDQTIGHYQLGDLIGQGAMGEVYQGSDVRDGSQVAIKMLSRASLSSTQHVQRFLRELQNSSQIVSPNVVKVLDIGDRPLPHLVMERLVGRDLSAILRTRRVMSHARVIDLIRQVGAGITAAGAAGVIHRDLKPQNIFLAGATWKILDFGVSRLAESGDTLTAGHIIGTPSYMAPEQASGAELDHRADLYALAVIAYRALTGHTPFASGKVAETLYRVVHTAPHRPSSHTPLHEDVDLVLAIGLAKHPEQRFATAGELADRLAEALVGTLPEPIRKRGRALCEGWTDARAGAAVHGRPGS